LNQAGLNNFCNSPGQAEIRDAKMGIAFNFVIELLPVPVLIFMLRKGLAANLGKQIVSINNLC